MTQIKIMDVDVTFNDTDFFKVYRILYNFHHSKMGFQNSITIEALNEDHALVTAMEEVSKCYGKKMFRHFTFKPDPAFTPYKCKP